MFRPTDRQMGLLGPSSQLSEQAERRLEQSWAEGFHRKVLPILLDAEERFADLYSDVGRPNWSVARLLGLLIIQQFQDLDDQSLLDNLTFDLRYQRALGIESIDEASLSRRSFVGFRSRLVNADPEMQRFRDVFEAVCVAAIEELGISVRDQRLDSTFITSNIRKRGQADLFAKTLRHCLDRIQHQWPEEMERLGAELLEWYRSEPNGHFDAADSEQLRALRQQRAEWLVEVMEAFSDHEEIAADERYEMVVRVIHEQCELVASGDDGGDDPPDDSGGPRVKVRRVPQPKGTSLQSPFDPDATRGRKGTGYHTHITETCNNEGSEVITDYAVTGAHVPDSHQSVPSLERLDEAGLRPKRLFADGGYGNAESIMKAADGGTKLHAPISRGKLPRNFIGRESFRFDADGHVTSCPRGHAPTRHGKRYSRNESTQTLHAYFDGAICRSCDLRGRCATRPPSNGGRGEFHLELLTNLRVRDQVLHAMRQPDWRDVYRIRSGVEATMSELKRRHGIGKLRVRGLARVRMMVALKVTACNVKRWLRAAAAQHAPAPEPADAASGPWIRLLGDLWSLWQLLRLLLAARTHARWSGPHTTPRMSLPATA